MAQLTIVRHGQSEWNLQNRFTGWEDVALTEKGIEEAKGAGVQLKGMHFDEAYTSDLKRAQDTLQIILKECGMEGIPVTRNEALNERHYGDLQGLNKSETAAQYGDEQVHIWRRSYDVAPPNGESLKDTAARVLPYYEKEIEPKLKAGENIIIAAHGNSLRALIMHIEKLSPEQILKREIGTAKPITYTFDSELNVLETKEW
ncbi:MAG: 2,3-bisphosphoglycerate-dependent phosphoglycerate mutase [Bacteroidetes bacterium]|nr:2,3-bisphosphoglycerate-dependent phosphoglycerate mutase [Bacteroidota bacterium]